MLHHRSQLRPFLSRLTSRSVLSDLEQVRILELPVRVKRAKTNEDFVAPGQRVDHACFVIEGLVGRFDKSARGERQITALHIGGDMPDLQSVVQPTATSALQALTESKLLEVPHVALRAAARAHPAIAEAFWRDCMADSLVLRQWVVNIGRRNALARVAHLLCEMACRYRNSFAAGTIVYELPMTQAQLADATGLTPVHVNRTLQKLAPIGTSFRNRVVRIADWDKLVEVGDFDPAYLQEELRPDERIRIVH